MSKKRRLIESLEVRAMLAGDPKSFSMDGGAFTESPDDVVFSMLCSEWTGMPYAELSVLIAHLRALQCIHQTNHWQARGDSFYGDHLLFDRLYQAVTGEIDSVAEKAVGLGCVENVRLDLMSSQTLRLLAESTMHVGMLSIPQQTDLAKRSMVAELKFLRHCALASDSLKSSGLLTRGLDNMLQGIEDVHEGHVYLLKQRTVGF